jgi:hypothetical protein
MADNDNRFYTRLHVDLNAADPKGQVLAIVRIITQFSQELDQGPPEAIITLMTAAAKIYRDHAQRPDNCDGFTQNAMVAFECAQEFFSDKDMLQ